MKTNRLSEPQILAILRQVKGGVAVPELCREHGMDASIISQMEVLEDRGRAGN